MVIVRDGEHESPFVREMLVESLTRAGMKPWQAHSTAREIEEELEKRGEIEISELWEMTYDHLRSIDKTIAERYNAWREIKGGENEPLIILLGGGTGVGTTTVGTELAHRMGIKNTIATDSVREVIRRVVSEELLPALHASSYDAHKHINLPISKDRVISGFELQVAAVSVGIEAIVERAMKEGTPTLIEGLHIVPGFLKRELLEKENVMMFVLHVKDEKKHRDQLYSRAFETKFKRGVDRYMENFKSIRRIQEYIKKKAEELRVPVIENIDVEECITDLMDRILKEVVKSRR